MNAEDFLKSSDIFKFSQLRFSSNRVIILNLHEEFKIDNHCIKFNKINETEYICSSFDGKDVISNTFDSSTENIIIVCICEDIIIAVDENKTDITKLFEPEQY